MSAAPEYHTRYVVGSIHYFKFVLKILPGSRSNINSDVYVYYMLCYESLDMVFCALCFVNSGTRTLRHVDQEITVFLFETITFFV